MKAPNALFEGVWQPGERHQVWMSHGDRISAIPPGFRVMAVSDGAPFAAIADEKRQIYGTQFKSTPQNTMTQEPYDQSLIPDLIRAELGVPDLASQREQLKSFTAGPR